MAVKEQRTIDTGTGFRHPLYQVMLETPGLTVGTAVLDDLLSWGLTNSMWIFPMATSCCGIELMATAASRVDIDRMGVIVRATPRQADVMVVAGTITTKMAPRVLKLWEQMPEPKWCIAMGSCAISGDFYRNLYSVVPGIDTFLPVDVYVPGCPPNPEALMHGMLRLQEKVKRQKQGETVTPEPNPDLLKITRPSVPRLNDPTRSTIQTIEQERASTNPTADEACAPLVVAATEPPPNLAPLTAADFEGLLKELGVTTLPPDGPPIIPAAQHLELARRLKGLGYHLLVTIVASHWPAGKGRKGADAAEVEHYEVAYALRTVGQGSRVATWAVKVPVAEPVLTLSGVFAGADWQEREQYDLVGVKFAGHPDLRRLMLTENASIHPLRREFPADAAAAPWR
ncbi:MAG: NADH-quinone oxidoreductase subunit NuoB [Myxococcaceae bacterium]|nr:NADH-quinone oxidoreductase subunit NuoB [Myxococcaceae bacterium]